MGMNSILGYNLPGDTYENDYDISDKDSLTVSLLDDRSVVYKYGDGTCLVIGKLENGRVAISDEIGNEILRHEVSRGVL